MKTKRFQTQPLFWQQAPAVDREALTISGAVSMTADTEALGHGVMTDRRTLEIANELAAGHRGGLGIQGRFGHPGMSENTMGMKFMLSHNFRLGQAQGKLALLHDIQLMPEARLSPKGNLVDYVMEMAANQPGEIAESFVMNIDAVWTMPDGSELDADDDSGWPADTVRDPEDTQNWVQRPLDALTSLPVMRPVSLLYLDMVNEGALTHQGLFSNEQAAQFFSGTSSTYSQELFDFIDQFRTEYNIPLAALPEKLDSILGKYLASRSNLMPGAKGTNSKAATAVKGQGARSASASNTSEAVVKTQFGADGNVVKLTEAAPPVVDEQAEVDTTEADPLDEAEQTADATDEVIAPVVEAPPEAVADEPRVDQLEARVERLVNLVVRQGEQIRLMAERLGTIEGEPLVTDRVKKFTGKSVSMERGNGAGRASSNHATPPRNLQAQNPVGMERRGQQRAAENIGTAGGNVRQMNAEDDAAQQVLLAQQRRQQRQG